MTHGKTVLPTSITKLCILHPISWTKHDKTEEGMSAPMIWWSSIIQHHKLFRWIFNGEFNVAARQENRSIWEPRLYLTTSCLLHACWVEFEKLKGSFHPKHDNSVITHSPQCRWKVRWCPKNISRASQQNSVTAFILNNRSRWGLVYKIVKSTSKKHETTLDGSSGFNPGLQKPRDPNILDFYYPL